MNSCVYIIPICKGVLQVSHFINLYQEEFLEAFFILTLFIVIVALVVIMQETIFFYRLHKRNKYKKSTKEVVSRWL